MAEIYAGVGTTYMRPIDEDGNPVGGFAKAGEAYPLSVKVGTKQVKRLSRMVETAGQTIASKTEIEETVGSLTLHEAVANNLAWALSGTKVALTGAGGSVVDEAVTAPEAGEFISLAQTDVTGVVVTSSGGVTTYEAGKDYEVDTYLGLFTILEGAIAKADSIEVSYSYAAKSGYQINIGTKSQIRVQIVAHLRNEFSGRDLRLELDDVILSANQEINFISEEGSEGEKYQFDMTLLTPDGGSSPGRVNGVPL